MVPYVSLIVVSVDWYSKTGIDSGRSRLYVSQEEFIEVKPSWLIKYRQGINETDKTDGTLWKGEKKEVVGKNINKTNDVHNPSQSRRILFSFGCRRRLKEDRYLVPNPTPYPYIVDIHIKNKYYPVKVI